MSNTLSVIFVATAVLATASFAQEPVQQAPAVPCIAQLELQFRLH